jgi:Amt family ammonium transporter
MITLKGKLGYDDSLDAFGVHGVGGIIGATCLTFFIRDSWWTDAGTKVSGWNWFSQLKVQLFAVGTTIIYAAIMTLIIGFIIQKTIGLRMTENGEKTGMDHDLHGERGYGLNNVN